MQNTSKTALELARVARRAADELVGLLELDAEIRQHKVKEFRELLSLADRREDGE